MKNTFKLLTIGSTLLSVVGCSSSQKLELDSDKEYFNASEVEALKVIAKHISTDFEPKFDDSGENPIVELKPYGDNAENTCAVFANENAISKADAITATCLIYPDDSTIFDFDSLEEKYIFELGTDIMESVDVENGKEVIEKTYLDLKNHYGTSGLYENEEVYALAGVSGSVDDGVIVSTLVIKPVNSSY